MSQYKQDEVLLNLCYPTGKETHKGTFIDVGAWDGMEISNTYTLEKVKGWTGVLVEPINTKAQHASHNRWCPVWNGCVYDYDGEVEFLHIKGFSEMLSGIETGYHPQYLQRVKGEITQHRQETAKVKLPCRTINGLLESFGMSGVDFLSLDTQTAELAVLKAYDAKKHPIKAICLDFNSVNVTELKGWFEDNGYQLHWKNSQSDEYLYVNPSIKWSWE